MDWTPTVAVVVALSIATITDVRELKVPNWLTLPVLLAGVAYHGVTYGFGGFQSSLFNVVVVVGVLFLPFLLGAIGAGDVKLVAALGAWLGTSTTFAVAAVGLFATGIYSLAQLAKQRRLADSWLHFKLSIVRLQMVARHLGSDGGHQTVHDLAKTAEGRARLVPFSAMLAFGMIVALGWQIWSVQ